ncbi:MAG: hypothetical protein ABIP75_02980 [Pyrinomonadaceae bacterium]
MNSPNSHKNPGELTPESFAKLLQALGPDREQAAEAYEQLRRKLVRVFEWRGSVRSDELADETLNRLGRKIDEGEVIRNISSYAGGVARLIWFEALKRQARENQALETLSTGSAVEPPDTSRNDCLERCLEKLPGETRALILSYYRAEQGAKIEGRKRLAEKLGLPLNALRIRAHRTRLQLEKCVVACMRKAELG